MQIYGSSKERERKIKYYEQYGTCSDCYKAEKNKKNAEGCEEVRMSYREYKTSYADCNTKADSYDKDEKTIIVYVRVERSVEENTPMTEEETKEACQKEAYDAIKKTGKKPEEINPTDLNEAFEKLGINVERLRIPEAVKDAIINKKDKVY